MEFIPHIQAVYDCGKTADGKHAETLLIETVTEEAGDAFLTYHARITNVSDRSVLLETVSLAESENLAVFGLGPEPYRIFRSGRHKNDMPGVFETGCMDERLADVSAVMAENGGRMEAAASERTVISDHLTLIADGSGKTLAVEFLTGRDQLLETRILLDDAGRFVKFAASTLFRTRLEPGETAVTETIRLALPEDVPAEIDAFAERKARLYGSRNSRRPAVFCTWYYYGLTVTCADLLRNLEIMWERRLPYDVFQLDEGWEVTLGEYEPNEKFPLPMKELASRIRSAGYTPGLWSSPFVAHETASVWRGHPEWILRDRAGNPCLFPMNDTVYYVFDITNAATWPYFRELYRRFTFDWGYTYHKLDFTRAAVIFENAAYSSSRITLAQAYYQAVKAIREGMGEDAFLLMCGGLYDPVIGLADAQRTGSDVLSMWSTGENKGGKTAPYTIRQSLMRCYMNRWWANDPDALMIRENRTMERGLRLTYGLLTPDEVRTCVVNQFAGGGLMCQTEPLDRIAEERLMEIRRLLPVQETEVRLPAPMSGTRFPEMVDVRVKKTDVHCVCIINWSDTEEKPVRLRLGDLPLDPACVYAVCDYYSGQFRTDAGSGDTVGFPPLRPHAACVIKIEKQADHPIIVASDGHYAMGAECSRLEISDGMLRVRRMPVLPVATHYTILLPEGWRCGNDALVSVTLGPDQTEAEVPVRRAESRA